MFNNVRCIARLLGRVAKLRCNFKYRFKSIKPRRNLSIKFTSISSHLLIKESPLVGVKKRDFVRWGAFVPRFHHIIVSGKNSRSNEKLFGGTVWQMPRLNAAIVRLSHDWEHACGRGHTYDVHLAKCLPRHHVVWKHRSSRWRYNQIEVIITGGSTEPVEVKVLICMMEENEMDDGMD